MHVTYHVTTRGQIMESPLKAQTVNNSTPKPEKTADGGASLGETYLVQRTEGEWHVAELIQKRENPEKDESEYYVHYDGCE